MDGFRIRSLLCDMAFGLLLQLRSTDVYLDDVETIECADLHETFDALSKSS
jgi:hypothetical protein